MANNGRSSAMMTPGEVARLLHVHINTVRRWSNQGLIEVYRIGPRGDRRFMQEDITHLLYELQKNNGNVNKARLACV